MDVAVAGVVGGELRVGFGPRVGFGQNEAVSVAAGPPGGAGGPRGGIGMEDPFGADACQHLGWGVGQPCADGDGVIAGVEDEHGVGVVVAEEADEALHLVDGRRGGVGGGRDALGVGSVLQYPG